MDRKAFESLQSSRRQLDAKITELVGASANLLEPLSTLTAPQKDAVRIMLLLVDQINPHSLATLGAGKKHYTDLISSIGKVLPLSGSVRISGHPCMDAEVAYVSALASCEKKHTKEEDCMDAWGPGSQAVACQMKEIQNLMGMIGQILQNQVPPHPIPWPT